MTCENCVKYGTICCGTLDLMVCKNFVSKDYLSRNPTNRDKVDILTDEEFVKFMLYDLPCLKSKMTSTEQGMLKWLQAPYNWEDFRVSRHKDYSEMIARIEDKRNES